MSRQTISRDWVTLAAAAKREKDPHKFMSLLKQLYDVVNTRENESEPVCEMTPRRELERAA